MIVLIATQFFSKLIKISIIVVIALIAFWLIYSANNNTVLSTSFVIGDTRLLVPNHYFDAAQMKRWQRWSEQPAQKGMDSVSPKLALRIPTTKFIDDANIDLGATKVHQPFVNISVWNRADNSEALTDAHIDIILKRGRFENFLLSVEKNGKYTKLTHKKDIFDVKIIDSKLLSYSENQLRYELKTNDVFIGHCSARIRRLSMSVCSYSLWDGQLVYDISTDAALIEKNEQLSNFVINLFKTFRKGDRVSRDRNN